MLYLIKSIVKKEILLNNASYFQLEKYNNKKHCCDNTEWLNRIFISNFKRKEILSK